LVMLRETGDKTFTGHILGTLGSVAHARGDYARATALYEESLAISRDQGYRIIVTAMLASLGNVAGENGDYERAATLLQESLTLSRELGNKGGAARALRDLASVKWRQGDYAQAVKLLDECLTLQREIGDKPGIAYTQPVLGDVARSQGDYERATMLYRESLLHHLKEDRWGNAESLRRLAAMAGVQGQPERAARLFAAAAAIRAAIGAPLPPADRADVERDIAAVRAQLDEATFNAAWDAGQKMILEEAVAYALEDVNEP